MHNIGAEPKMKAFKEEGMKIHVQI
jgi:hypothetical protein